MHIKQDERNTTPDPYGEIERYTTPTAEKEEKEEETFCSRRSENRNLAYRADPLSISVV